MKKIEGYFITCGITKEFNDYLEFLRENEVIEMILNLKVLNNFLDISIQHFVKIRISLLIDQINYMEMVYA